MPRITEDQDREATIARILRPLGTGPLSRSQARLAANLLSVHWTTVYRLRKRFLADPVASAVRPRARGPKAGNNHLGSRAEVIMDDVLTTWLPGQRQLAHPLADLTLEIRRRCTEAGVTPPGRHTVARRLVVHRDAEMLAETGKRVPGNFVVESPMDIVQVDHTQADVLVVDPVSRQPIGRPWLSLAIDVATRCVMGFHVDMERPGAATVALLLTRVALPKGAWLETLGLQIEWPMRGVPKVLHLDNAAEFKSRALRTCVFRTKVTGRFGIVTGDFGNVTVRSGNVTDRTGRQDWRCA